MNFMPGILGNYIVIRPGVFTYINLFQNVPILNQISLSTNSMLNTMPFSSNIGAIFFGYNVEHRGDSAVLIRKPVQL